MADREARRIRITTISHGDGDVRPSGDELDESALLREMNQVGGGLFLVGGSIVLLVALFGNWPGQRASLLVLAGVVALGPGVTLSILSRRSPTSLRALELLAVFATANITLSVAAAGPDGAAALGVLYVFVTMFSFYYFPNMVAIVEGVLTAVGFAIGLSFVDVGDPVTLWAVVTAANMLIAVLIGRAGRRVRVLLVSEQASVVRLQELDGLRTAFLRAVSHELRTPLTSVIGYAELLQRKRTQLPDEQVDLLIDRIQSNARRLERLLGNLLDIDRISRSVIVAQRERVHVGRVVEAALNEMASDTHPITVRIEGMPVAAVEASKVERIVENLVGNARRHTPAGTAIRVIVQEHEDGVLVVVEDDGPGVPESLRDRLFEPFVQGASSLDAASPGTGIGLSLVAKFAELHGGRASVSTAPSGGARFEVHLPEATATGDAQQDAEAISAAESATPA